MRVVFHSNPGLASLPLVLAVGIAYAWVVGRILSGAQAHRQSWPDFLNRSGSVLGRVPSAKQREPITKRGAVFASTKSFAITSSGRS